MWEDSRVNYRDLNSRQQENYNFQKVSAVLAEYGFATIRLTDDWQGADFIANHVDGDTFLKVQLKGVLTLDQKYVGKDIYICFRRKGTWYMYPHDEFLAWALKNTNVRNTKGWEVQSDGTVVAGKYTWPSPNKNIVEWLSRYALTSRST
ncbi:MAG: hypothetical protein O3A47_06000 [Chloroflexi bacterium]|nr:hypothetical protein [Chloroflexota bacterium]